MEVDLMKYGFEISDVRGDTCAIVVAENGE